MKSGENGLIGPGSNDYGRNNNIDERFTSGHPEDGWNIVFGPEQRPDFKPLEHLGGGQNKLIQDLILQSNSIGKLLDSALARYEQALVLLMECQKALNQVPNTNISKATSNYKDTYQLVSDISKFLKDGVK